MRLAVCQHEAARTGEIALCTVGVLSQGEQQGVFVLATVAGAVRLKQRQVDGTDVARKI
jgi:hypothetical protein